MNYLHVFVCTPYITYLFECWEFLLDQESIKRMSNSVNVIWEHTIITSELVVWGVSMNQITTIKFIPGETFLLNTAYLSYKWRQYVKRGLLNNCTLLDKSRDCYMITGGRRHRFRCLQYLNRCLLPLNTPFITTTNIWFITRRTLGLLPAEPSVYYHWTSRLLPPRPYGLLPDEPLVYYPPNHRFITRRTLGLLPAVPSVYYPPYPQFITRRTIGLLPAEPSVYYHLLFGGYHRSQVTNRELISTKP